MERVDVNNAARVLHVSPMQVGRLIKAGELRASRFGRSWEIDLASLHAYRALSPKRGRPYGQERSWALLLGSSPENIEAAAKLASAVRRRGSLHKMRALPGFLPDLLADHRVRLGGGDTALDHGCAVMPPAEHVAYIRDSDLPGVFVDYRLFDAGARNNITLRGVADDVWPTLESPLPLAVAIVDLIDLDDIRSVEECLRR